MKKVKVKKDKSKYVYYVIAVGVLLLFLIILISSLLDIGEKLRNISVYLEYGFYGLVVLLFYFIILQPIIIILKSPSLSIATSLDQNNPKAVAIYKKVAKNIVKSNELPEEEKILLTQYKNKEELLYNLQYVFEKTVKGQLNRIIIHDAKTVMISTAICQSARFDMITVFAVNVKMVKELVVQCGFRPSMKNLSKLTINVFGTALIAEGLENLKLEDIMPKSSLDFLNNMPYLGVVLESVIQGAANALMTLRIGCVCRRYLFSDGSVITKEDIRKQAYKETLKLLPMVVADTISFFPKRIVKFFTNRRKVKEEEEFDGAGE
ncbi:MAG: YcjF family protein [Anaeroplasmataceae bacterium]|nr:YcjF family protein [Anaeroplasmataceae bacterium]MDE6415208.1 YcjF family protein [Anaeroplasmataceae bacterium]